METFSDHISLFVDYLRSGNKSEVTIKQYKSEVEKFIRFLQDKSIVQENHVQLIHIDAYRSMLLKTNKNQSIAKKLSILKSFFWFLQSRGIIEKNVMSGLESVKIKQVDRKKKDALDVEEAFQLIEKTREWSSNKYKKRNVLLVSILLFCGLRVSELCQLTWDQVDLKNKTLYINGKGGKVREVPLDSFLIELFKDYKIAKKDRSIFVFASNDAKKKMSEEEHISQRTVHDLIKRYVKKAKIKKNIGCHALRRSAATILLSSGVNLRSIQLFLGHSNIATTTLYLNPDKEEVKREIRDKNLLHKKIVQHMES